MLIDCVTGQNSMLIARMSFLYNKATGEMLKLSSESDIVHLLNSDLKDNNEEFAEKRTRLIENLTNECVRELTYRGVIFRKQTQPVKTGSTEITYRGKKMIIDHDTVTEVPAQSEESDKEKGKMIKGYYRGQPIYDD